MDFKNTLLTPISLWENFDDGLPLKGTSVNKIKVDGATMSEVYFSGRNIDGERVRVYGYYSEPDNAVKGAILYLSGEDEVVGSESFKEFLHDGYAVLAVDIYGKRDNVTNYTEYPSAVSYANLSETGRHKDFVDESARETCWFEWVSAGRYAVKYLKELGHKFICVAGDKTGANVGWQLVAFDKNVSCFIALFGAGWTAYKNMSKFDQNAEEPIESEESFRKYVAAVDAHAYAPYVKCPVLYLTSTNSKFFDFDRAGDTLSRIRKTVPCYYNYSVGYDVHLDLQSKNDIIAFLSAYMSDNSVNTITSPELAFTENGNKLKFTVDCDIQKATSVKIYISEGIMNAAYRNWKRYDITKNENGEYALEYLSVGKLAVFAFCVVDYSDGITLSSKEVLKRYDTQIDKHTTSKLIYSGKRGLNGLTFIDDEPTSIVFEDKYVEEVEGADNIIGAYSKYGLKSYKFSEPDVSIGDASMIKFDIFVKEYCPLTLTLYENAEGEVKKYHYIVELKSENIWQNILVKISDFKSDTGIVVKNFDKLVALSVNSDAKFIINNVLII